VLSFATAACDMMAKLWSADGALRLPLPSCCSALMIEIA